MKNIVIVILFLLSFNCYAQCSKPTKSGGTDAVESGCFDYYIFSQAWGPQFCLGGPKGTCQNLTRQMKTQLTIHGIWPTYYSINDKTAWPQNCINSPGCNTTDACQFTNQKVTCDSLNTLSNFVPLSLLLHEWSKHGTCMNMSQQSFVQTMLDAENKFKTPQIIQQNIGKALSYQDLVKAYGGAEYVSFACNQQNGIQYLSEVRHFLDKKLNIIKKPSGYNDSCNKAAPIQIRKAI